MKHLLYYILFISITNSSYAQKSEDNLIIVTVSDSTDLYNRVRKAITFTDLIIREDSKPDTLITYSEKIYDKSIFIIAKVIIDGNQVKITGAYGLDQENFWGYPAWPKSYKQVSFFKGSEGWIVLRKIAIKLDGKIDYIKSE
jgi:hypothetical protein